MREVNGAAALRFYRLEVLLVEDVGDFCHFSGGVIASELNGRESDLRLLHIIVNLLVEILRHVCLDDNREVIAVPFTRAARL